MAGTRTEARRRADDALDELRAALRLPPLPKPTRDRCIAILLGLQRRTTSTVLAPVRAATDDLHGRIEDVERDRDRLREQLDEALRENAHLRNLLRTA